MSDSIFFIDEDICKAKTLPSKFYLNQEYFDLTINKIFKQCWQLITDINYIGENNIFPFTLLRDTVNEPLFFSLDNNKINCLSNVCTHRGSILCQSTKKCNIIQCAYHGRTFNLSGTLKAAPGFDGAQDFPTNNDNLSKCEVLEWKQFILTGINPDIDLSNIFKDIDNRLNFYPFKNLVYNKSASKEYILDANWALYCENYLEGFHVQFVHPGLKNDIKLNSYKTILLDNGVLQFTESSSKEGSLNEDNIYAYYYWIFPNMMLNFYSWGLSINIIEPINNNKTRIRFLSYPLKNKNQPQEGDAALDKVENEDQLIVTRVQKGIKSRYYNAGRYSPLYEKGVHHFHLLLDSYLS